MTIHHQVLAFWVNISVSTWTHVLLSIVCSAVVRNIYFSPTTTTTIGTNHQAILLSRWVFLNLTNAVLRTLNSKLELQA